MVTIRTKKDALKTVAGWQAGILRASSLEEASGLDRDSLTDAEQDRLEWAMEEVQRRLYAMGGKD